MEITWQDSIVRVAVADRGGPTEPRVIEDPSAKHGRGLLLVRGLSVRTGVCGDRRGRLVWADVRWVSAEPTAQAAVGDSYEAAIRDGEAALARRFSGIPAWFGRATLQWWALPAPGRLVSAPSAQELAALLYRLAADTSSSRSAPARRPAAGAGHWAGSRRSREAGGLPWPVEAERHVHTHRADPRDPHHDRGGNRGEMPGERRRRTGLLPGSSFP